MMEYKSYQSVRKQVKPKQVLSTKVSTLGLNTALKT